MDTVDEAGFLNFARDDNYISVIPIYELSMAPNMPVAAPLTCKSLV